MEQRGRRQQQQQRGCGLRTHQNDLRRKTEQAAEMDGGHMGNKGTHSRGVCVVYLLIWGTQRELHGKPEHGRNGTFIRVALFL
ncbi:unnamed protein product [Sphagnum troendelagicum]|uniref:Uncharacterized protein n=1 Tax=Sphagnum troendelagicum TaxID=128251 RepID=A0ABP0TZS2_9BRYO